MAYNCIVRVTKFDDYNDKAKGKRILWHRMDATIWSRRDFVSTTPETKLMWWWLLAQASSSRCREVFVDARVRLDIGARYTRQLVEALSKLESLGWIQVLSVVDPPASIPLRTIRYEQYDTEVPVGDHESAKPPPPLKKTALKLPEEPKVNRLVAHYCDCWKAKYHSNPAITKQVAGQLRRLAKELGPDRAHALITAYLQMPDSWFVTKRHDVSTLITNLNAVVQFADTGKMITKAQTRELDSKINMQQTIDALRRGEV